MKTLAVYTLAWGGLVVLAIVNGIVREKVYRARLGELAAHQLSTLSALIVFSVYLGVLSRFQPIASAEQAVAVGGVWLVLTLAFEFLFGHFVAGHSWEQLLHDYNVLKGRLWLLVLLWTAVAPYVCYRLAS